MKDLSVLAVDGWGRSSVRSVRFSPDPPLTSPLVVTKNVTGGWVSEGTTLDREVGARDGRRSVSRASHWFEVLMVCLST